MMVELANYLQLCFSGANLPASILLIVVGFYWLLSIVTGLDLDFLDISLDLDADGALDSASGLGFVVLRFLNIGRVPLMLWISVFAVAYWLVSMLFSQLLDSPAADQATMLAAQLSLRNLAIVVVFTKLLTQPLRGKFDVVEPNRAIDLMGQECQITSSEVTDKFGQALFTTDGAPLILPVRTREQSLAKGDRAVIVEYDAEGEVYFVTRVSSEV